MKRCISPVAGDKRVEVAVVQSETGTELGSSEPAVARQVLCWIPGMKRVAPWIYLRPLGVSWMGSAFIVLTVQPVPLL
jgi:hypothetical protein